MKIRNIFYIALFAFCITSCESKLDVVPNGAPTEASFWKSEKDAIAAINGVYSDLTSEAASEALYGRGLMWIISSSDDMVIGRSRARVENMHNFVATGDEGEIKNIWVFPYRIIKRANDVIRNVPSIEMNEDLKKRILGEAHFISGLMYFNLAYVFGNEKAGVPILDIEDPLNYELSRPANVQVNYDFIVKEFSLAAQYLPYFDEMSKVDYGRAHKTTALAYLAKANLYSKKWDEAEKAANLIIDSKKHELLADYRSVFKIANNWSREYIWSTVSNQQFGSMLPGVMLENKGWGEYNGWGYYQPTKELYDAYEAGDLRREATILKFGDKFTFFGKERTYSSTNSLTGYQFNKYMEPFAYPDLAQVSANGDFPTTNLNVPLMRYAEVLLIAAEAKLMQGKNVDAELNQIRKRAGLAPKFNMTIDDLKNQRRCELAGEFADRNFDLIRWGDADEAYSKPKHAANGEIAWPARPQFNPAVHSVWPIPPSEINASKGLLGQNQGW